MVFADNKKQEDVMCHYYHFNIKERESLLILRNSGKTITEIAQELKRSKSTISRELKRNSVQGSYSACDAEKLYHARRRKCKRHKLLDNPETKKHIQTLIIEKRWSPEQIAKTVSKEDSVCQISYATIYRGIYAHLLETHKLSHGERGIVRLLRHKGKRRKKQNEEENRGKICISHPISERPAEANERMAPGHLEADTVLGKRGGECLVTLVDRMLRMGWIERAKSKSSADVNEAIMRIIKRLPSSYVKTITPDCGKEFANHAEISAKTAIEFYFPPPGSPWLRGTNENFNGLLREFVPKGCDISSLSDSQLENFEFLLNSRPRKCLNWNSPLNIFLNFCCT